MDRGLYIAASGMLAEMVRQDLIANDLANVSTPGYKSDRPVQHAFGDVLLHNTQTGQAVGPIGLGTAVVGQDTNLAPAPLQNTGNPLDFAVAGDGFFAVRTAQGVRYTRNGQFQTGPGGLLVDQVGNPVLDQNGATITVNGGQVAPARLGVYALRNPVKQGDNNFTGTAAGRAAGQAQSGELEGSGVDAAHTIVDMMTSLRAFESGQKAIQTIDETLDKAASQIGSLTS